MKNPSCRIAAAAGVLLAASLGFPSLPAAPALAVAPSSSSALEDVAVQEVRVLAGGETTAAALMAAVEKIDSNATERGSSCGREEGDNYCHPSHPQPQENAGISSNGDASLDEAAAATAVMNTPNTASSLGGPADAAGLSNNAGASVAASSNEKEEDVEFWKPRLSDLEVYAGVYDDDDEDDDEEDNEEDDDYEEDSEDYGDEEEEEYLVEYYEDDDLDKDDDLDDEDDDDEISSPQPHEAFPVVGGDPNAALGSDPAADLGEPQKYPAQMEDGVRDVLDAARTYLQTVVHGDDAYAPVRNLCRNKDPSCAAWAAQGECRTNPRFMNFTCAPVCRSCDLLHASTRCKVDPTVPAALSEPGDLDRLFERIVSDREMSAQYQIKVLSRPSYAEGDTLETADYQLGMWLLQLDAFATPDECERLIELGQSEGYVRSADVGEEKEDGTFEDDVNSGRTSMNSWCGEECHSDMHAMAVMERMANITGIPEANQEHLQLLRYEVGQYYQTHNDYIPYQVLRQVGPRILTFYVYLQDVPSGGETEFPRLGLKVAPKQGRAVLWPSVLNSHPDAIDPRSDHQALPVLEGTKYGANAWIHQRDYKNDDTDGVCT